MSDRSIVLPAPCCCFLSFRCVFQVLGLTGIILAVLQLGIFPPTIRCVGIVNWQRAGCLLGVPVFLAVPNARFFSWNESSLFAVSVLDNILSNCCISSVSEALKSFFFSSGNEWSKKECSLLRAQPFVIVEKLFWCRLHRGPGWLPSQVRLPRRGKAV